MQSFTNEIYPVGTDILSMYIGVGGSGRLLLTNGTTFNNSGEVVSGNDATSEVYIPVSMDYTYEKGARRLTVYYYDNDKAYLGKSGKDTWLPEAKVLPAFPANTEFIRIRALGGGGDNWMPSKGAKITRTA